MLIVDFVARTVFGLASIALMLLAGALIVYAGKQVGAAYQQPDANVGSTLLEAVGFTIIAIAVFDIGKYLLEEEAIRGREMRRADEARRSMTKFISTIAIAVFLESLVTVFQASKTDVKTMIYPTILLFGGVTLVVGLGIYQRLSAVVEKDVGADDDDKEDRAETARRPGMNQS